MCRHNSTQTPPWVEDFIFYVVYLVSVWRSASTTVGHKERVHFLRSLLPLTLNVSGCVTVQAGRSEAWLIIQSGPRGYGLWMHTHTGALESFEGHLSQWSLFQWHKLQRQEKSVQAAQRCTRLNSVCLTHKVPSQQSETGSKALLSLATVMLAYHIDYMSVKS